METIDCTPTWEAILPLLFELLGHKDQKTRDEAREECVKMARAADNWNAHIKANPPKEAGLLPNGNTKEFDDYLDSLESAHP